MIQSFGPFVVTYRAHSRSTLVDGVWTPDAPEQRGEVFVLVDPQALVRQLGARALRSKGGIAKEAKGAVVVRKRP